MSFSRPHNVPQFSLNHRNAEDTIWKSAGSDRSGAGSDQRGRKWQIGSMFSHDDRLPLYKDKPYATKARRRPLWPLGRAVTLALVLALFFASLYFTGVVFRSPSDLGTARRPRSRLHSILGVKTPLDWDDRRQQVKEAFRLSWSAYERHAWGYDEFYPISKTGRHMVDGGLGWIIVDALDTLMLMNMTTELAHAQDWISTALNYEKDHDVNVFETTIRMLGGLLSAHYISTTAPAWYPQPADEKKPTEDFYLEKATDLADRLIGAFESPSGIPYASVNLKTMKGIPSHADGGASSTAEATTLQLELKYLSKLTGEKLYWEKAEKVMQVVDDNKSRDGLAPIYISADTGTFRGNNIRLGSRGDSYYEYLIKQYLQTQKQEPVYQELWDQALDGVKKHLVTYSAPSNFTVLGERPDGLDGALSPKVDHLVCFMPGTIALAATGGLTVAEAMKQGKWGEKQEQDLLLAKQLMKTCWTMYKATASGISPEITYYKIHDPPIMMNTTAQLPVAAAAAAATELSEEEDADWRQDVEIKPADRHNIQRPETVESLFYLWRITGDVTYRNWGWDIFESFKQHAALADDGGYTSLADVTVVPPPRRDSMESFWLAETLKYFYLLFGPDDILPLDQIVFNTEAHPLPRFELGKLFSTGWQRQPRDAAGV